jgi:small-conductance mechanosensitive channel
MPRAVTGFLLLCVLAIAPALAADAPSPSRGESASAARNAARSESAVLEIGQREILTFHTTSLGYSPEERVEGARRRLLSAYRNNPNVVLTVRSIAEGAQVLADGSPVFLVSEDDVNTLAGDTAESIANLAASRLQTVVAERRESSDPEALATGGGLAALATLIWVLALRLTMALDRRVGGYAARAAAERVKGARLSGISMLDPGRLLRIVRGLVRLLAWAVGFAVTSVWLNAALASFPPTRPWGDRLLGYFVEVLATVGLAMLDALPGLLFVAIILMLARVLARIGAAFFEKVRAGELNFGWLDRDTAPPTRAIFTAGVWIFALAMAYPYLPGAKSQAFQGLSVMVGLMVSLGASSTVGQAASGLILMYTRAFRVGEYVRFSETEGTVTELGLFVTRVRTGLGEEVLLPNTLVLAQTSKNYSRAVAGPGFVIDTVVTIGYDAPWRQVHAMLIEAAQRTGDVVADPRPFVVQTALADFYVEYRLVAYARAEGPGKRAQTLNQMHANIQDVFNEHGVQIMSPHYMLDPTHAKVVPKARWWDAPAAPDTK